MCGFSCNNGLLSGAAGAEKVLGHAAVSLAGHDAGKIYLVVGVRAPGSREEMLLLADGSSKRFEAPKAKKTKHVSVLKARSEAVRFALIEGKKVDDSIIVHELKEVRRSLPGRD